MYIAFPLFEKIDGKILSVFSIIALNQFDAISKQLQVADDEWRFTKGLDAETMAALIQDDKIDILLDLAGHTEHNFLSTFAKKPAPIQATWGAYPATSESSSMDYVITDRIMLPPDSPQKSSGQRHHIIFLIAFASTANLWPIQNGTSFLRLMFRTLRLKKWLCHFWEW